MDELIKFLKDKYIEDIVAPLELHKLIIFCGFVGTLSLPSKDDYLGSIWLNIGSINIKTILDPDSNIWSEITVFQILLSFLLTLFMSPVYSRLKSDFFQVFSKIQNIDAYLSRLVSRIRGSLTGNKAFDLILVKDISKDLNTRKKKLIRFHVWGEICITCIVISVIGLAQRVNTIDFVVAIIFLCTVIFIQWRAYLYYLEKVVPVALPEKILRDGGFERESEY